MSRLGTAVAAGVHEYRRTPVLLALVVVLPAYAIALFGYLSPDPPVVLHVAGETVRTGLPDAVVALMTPMTAALVGGIAGLFLMQAAADADGRLWVAGYRAHELVLARLGLLAAAGVVVTAVSLAVMSLSFSPDHLTWFALATLLATLVYGMVGVLTGVVLDRLAGVYVLLFGPLVDLFLYQNPLAADSPDLAVLLPGHFPMSLAMRAGFADTVPLEPVAGALGALAAVTLLAVGAFYRTMRV